MCENSSPHPLGSTDLGSGWDTSLKQRPTQLVRDMSRNCNLLISADDRSKGQNQASQGSRRVIELVAYVKVTFCKVVSRFRMTYRDNYCPRERQRPRLPCGTPAFTFQFAPALVPVACLLQFVLEIVRSCFSDDPEKPVRFIAYAGCEEKMISFTCKRVIPESKAP